MHVNDVLWNLKSNPCNLIEKSTTTIWHFTRIQITLKHLLALDLLAIKRLFEAGSQQKIKSECTVNDWSSVLPDTDKKKGIWDKNPGSKPNWCRCLSPTLVRSEQFEAAAVQLSVPALVHWHFEAVSKLLVHWCYVEQQQWTRKKKAQGKNTL